MKCRKTAMVPRPAPRFTQQQLQSEICPEKPDPKYIIEKIQRDISCLQSEKNRLDARFTELCAEKTKLLEINQNLEIELENITAETDNIIEEIKMSEDQIVSLTKDVSKVQKNAGDIQSSLLSGEHYESKLKELKQLQIKKTIVAKKLKSSKKIIQRNDFTNFRDALQMYQDDINTLEVNNMVIEKQIQLVAQQVSRCYNSSDQQKLKELYSSKDNEIQILLQKIRDAQRKESSQIPQYDDLSTLENKNTNMTKQVQNKSNSNNNENVQTETKKSTTNKNLNIHHLRKQSLLYDINEELDDLKLHIDLINESIERLLYDKDNPNMDQNKIKEIECLKSEVDTISATIEGELKNVRDDAQSEEQTQLEIKRIETMLISRKEELDSIQAQKEIVLNEIDDIVKKRGETRKIIDDLLEDEHPDIQKLISKVQSFSKKCEEATDKLRDEESELNIKKEKLIEIRSSKDISKFNELLNQKSQIESEIPHLKGSFRQSSETNDEYDQRIDEMKQRKSSLIEKYKKYEKALKSDQQELNELENYANMLLTLINTNRNRRK